MNQLAFIASSALAVGIHASAQDLVSVASHTTDSFPAGTALTYGLEPIGNRVVVAFHNQLRWLEASPSGWMMTPEVIGSPAPGVVGFATSIRGDGSMIAVGCDSGHVFVYDARRTLQAPVASWRTPDSGRAIALTAAGDRVLVGRPKTDGTPGGGVLLRVQGAAVSVEHDFTAPAVPSAIGWSGGLSGDDVVISGERSAGDWHAWTWRRIGGAWTTLGPLSPSGAAGNPIFGCSSAIDGNLIAVGARDDSERGWQSGACFVFERNPSGWTQVAKIMLSEPPFNNQETGGSVSVRNGKVFVSAGGNMENGIGDRGRMLIASRRSGEWSLDQVCRASESGFPTFWGYSPRFGEQGTVYVFGADSPSPFTTWRARFDALATLSDCDSDMTPDVAGILGGITADVNSNLLPDACECIADIDRSGVVDGGDLGQLLLNWGTCIQACPGDLTRDGETDGADLGALLAAWGWCGA